MYSECRKDERIFTNEQKSDRCNIKSQSDTSEFSFTNKHEQNKLSTFDYNTNTVSFFYEITFLKNNNVYFHKIDKSKSFLRQFACFILSLWGISSTCRNTAGTSTTIPRLFRSTASSCNPFTELTILFSNNPNDQHLTFDDFNITQVANITRITDYPQLTYVFSADRLEITISDAYIYAGADTSIYAIGLRTLVEYWGGSALNTRFLFAKDVFDPPLQLLSNSRVDLSYKIVIAV